MNKGIVMNAKPKNQLASMIGLLVFFLAAEPTVDAVLQYFFM